MNDQKNQDFKKALWPLLFFIFLLVYGLFLHPQLMGQEMLPLEVLILLALSFSCLYLLKLGYKWKTIQDHIVKKSSEAIPVVLILFSIGVLIGSWIVCGTIPMLIYYGISIVDPDWIYLFAFLSCIIFSLLTGTSWGSAGTVGIVMLGIAQVYEADLAITAGAIVGGSFFGDKMSPLSDTTNIASLATEVPLFDHIRSMMYTTGPSAILAAIIYVCMSPGFSASNQVEFDLIQLEQTLEGLNGLFNFNLILLLPLLVVIVGSIKAYPTTLTLLCSAWLAMILAIVFQEFALSDIFQSFNKGFSVDMGAKLNVNDEVLKILNRGGLYNLIEGTTVVILVFAFIGSLNVLNSIDLVINRLMKGVKSRPKAVISTLTTALFTNLTTSNQYATSFIIGESFKKIFDKLKIPRRVLSRSIEDAGTMMENLAPWTPSGIFMATTLGVSALEYAPYQFLSWINILIAYFFAVTGIACFYKKEDLKSA